MRRRVLFPMLAAIAFAVMVCAGSAEARVFQRLRTDRPASRKLVRQRPRYQPARKTWSGFPTTLWDLGNHMGEWPPYHRH